MSLGESVGALHSLWFTIEYLLYARQSPSAPRMDHWGNKVTSI